MQDWFYFQFGEKKPFDYTTKNNKVSLAIPYQQNLKKKGDLLIAQMVIETNSALKTPVVKGPTKKIEYDSYTVFHETARNVFMAKIFGFCGFVNNRLTVVAPLLLDSGNSIARLYINPDDVKSCPNIDDIYSVIESKKIFPSIDKVQLEKNLANAINTKQKYVVIARGRAMEEAFEDYVISIIDLEKSVGKINNAGKIDYKDRDAIKEVFEGDVIGKFFPGNPGKEGFSVFGEKLLVNKTEKGPALGKNLYMDEDEPGIVKSKINGYINLKNKVLDVIETLIIEGDVDYEIGNIEFSGSIEIKGKVSSGFSVTTFGNLTVHGVVEGANLFSSHNMDLLGGVLSKEGYKIECLGNFSARYIQNAQVHVKKDMNIIDFIYHSNVVCNGKVKVIEKSGVILGGKLIVKKEVECNQAGNKNGVATEIIAGVDQDLDEKIKLKRKELNILIDRKNYIEEQLKKNVSPGFFRDPEIALSKICEEKRAGITTLFEQFQKLEKWIEKTDAEIETLDTRGPQYDFIPKIIIHKEKHPGVKALIYENGKRISEFETN
ncbi:MAG: FapA family protein [Leptospirales bacterium]